jgi:hypothetical protein
MILNSLPRGYLSSILEHVKQDLKCSMLWNVPTSACESSMGFLNKNPWLSLFGEKTALRIICSELLTFCK